MRNLKNMKTRFRHIYLEITNICNLSCPFCSIDDRKKEYMKLDDFKRYALMCKEYTNSIYLHIKGEPLMHPNFTEILDYLEAINLKVKLTTNGDFLNKNQDDILKHSNILRMNISLQSLVTKTLEEVEVYLKNLVGFLEKATNSGKMSISLRLWNDKENLKVTEYNTYIKNYLKEYFHSDFIDSKAIIPHVYASIEDEFTWPSEKDKDNLEKTKCLGGSTHIGILVNGEVVLCCLDSSGKTSFGSLKNKTLKEIVESDKFNKIVNDLKNGKPYFEICQKCTYRNRFK